MGIRAGGSQRELVKVELPRQHHPGFFELGGDERVLLGDTVAEETRTARRGDACRVVEVLEGEGDAVERPTVAPGGQFGVCDCGLFAGEVARDRDLRVEGWLRLFDALEDGLRQVR